VWPLYYSNLLCTLSQIIIDWKNYLKKNQFDPIFFFFTIEPFLAQIYTHLLFFLEKKVKLKDRGLK
jgi:hypothetical protein